MGTMFRSEEMALCQLYIQPEAVYLTVSELGEAGIVQFRDLNENVTHFQRRFVNEVRRCDDLERKLRYIEAEVKKDEVPIVEDLKDLPRAPNPRQMIDLEARVEKSEGDIRELSQNAVNLKSDYLELIELRHVLEKNHVFFAEDEANDSIRPLISDENQMQTIRGRLDFVAGVISRERMPAFERMLWRISRGNVFLRQANLDEQLEDPTTGAAIYKTVFVAFFQGEELKSRIKKVCIGFHASLYPIPNSHAERMEMVKGVRTRLEDLNLVLNQTNDHRQRVLRSVAKELPLWTIMVRKMKAIYHTMNLFSIDISKKCLIGECWAPISDLAALQDCLTEGSRLCGNSIPSFLNVIETNDNPPTFNRSTKYTRAFQILIDSYGVSSYREANPALYAIVTFPFLFAVMFGDVGHGLIMFLFGLYMVLQEKKFMAQKSTNEIWNIFFGGRYVILLMGLYSVYTGFVYNDLFSKSMNIFGSSWEIRKVAFPKFSNVTEKKQHLLFPKKSYIDHPYPIGVDPVWALAENKIIFLNSFKMKLSIIFGVVHMIFGVCMSAVNMVHFRKYASLFVEFLPQLLLLLVLFAYLAFLMFLKWVLYSGLIEGRYSEACAPSILITFINMMLFGSSDPEKPCEEFMFPGHATMQLVFLGIALVCIPVLLFGKPLHFLLTHRKKGVVHANGSASQNISNGVAGPSGSKGSHEEHEEFGEVMIQQAIHTIEYVLSTISHTASYLRLWALSLAHAQLSEVLWNMVMGKILSFPLMTMGVEVEIEMAIKGVAMFLAFGAWSVFTLAILVLMEGLSAFLHTLRLHWVEFMSKFYKGEGYLFQPYYFKTILDSEDCPDQD
ncbi:hypothetical protein TSAR_010511 [Trichomalopsis sarcophagae]|uniref:V-type proton ATPase subunit a n=1 Tax=Trichomalopsis sarcophagae TaxID=543379 RepID=A0A232EJZ3_9HYME|nr:hypothetical protein TSAR_010511 [Trichomalopsis sarcophagae]